MLSPRAIALRARTVERRIGTSTVLLRRGDATLAAQPGLVVLANTQASERRGEASRAPQGRAELWGLPALDVAVGDRLTAGGVAFRVFFVRPDRTAYTVADLEAAP
jgi:hypothetical protein